MSLRPHLRHIPIALVLAVAGAAYVNNLGNPFFGSDTWPWLVSTRIQNTSDVLRVAFSPIMSGTSFVAEVARFYHPLTALSYSLDQALFDLNANAFYATNLLIHLAAVGALYTLARGLGASWWASSACALVLGLHPVAAATVPSIPRRQDMVVGALLIGSMSLLARARIGAGQIRWAAVVGAIALFFLALGGKEIAYAGVAIVPFIIVCASSRTAGPFFDLARTLRAAMPVTIGFALLEASGFGVRWLLLGGLGGYIGSAAAIGSTQGIVEFFVRPYITDVLWPFQPLMPERLRDWLLLLGLVAVVLGVATAGYCRQRRLLILTGVAWQAAFLLLYAVVHTSLSPYLLYVPLAGLALLVAGLLDGTADRLTHSIGTNPWARLTGVSALVAAAGSALLLIGIVRTSALVTDYPEFRDASSVSRQFLEQAVPCLEAAPIGAVVEVDGLPHRIDYGSPESQFIDAYVFEPYSLESVARLLAPASRARFEVRSTQDVIARPTRIAVTCTPAGAQWQISTQVLS